MKTKEITLAAFLAALYIGIGLVIPPQFGIVQCRISDALYPLIAVLGMPAVMGLTLGHFIYNLYGFSTGAALGILDVIVSPVLFFIAKMIIQRYGYKGVPVHVIFVALWIAYLLNSLFGLPYWPSVVTVGIGEAIAEIVLGIPLAKLVKNRL